MSHSKTRNLTKLFLRIGLAFVFAWAGTKSLLAPADWIGFVPLWVERFGVARETFLSVHAGAEILLALWLLSGKWLSVSAAMATLSLLAILIGYGLDDLSFRDVGLLAAACALFTVSLSDQTDTGSLLG